MSGYFVLLDIENDSPETKSYRNISRLVPIPKRDNRLIMW